MNSQSRSVNSIFTTRMSRRTALRTFTIGVTALAVGATGTVQMAAAQTAKQYETTARLNFRSGPGTTYAVITVIPAGALVSHTGIVKNSFYEVGHNGTYGWVHQDYIVLAGGGSDPVMVDEKKTTANVNLRSGPSTGHQVLRVVSAGSVVQVSNTVQNGFRYVTHNGLAGWMADQYLGTGGSQPGGETFTTTANLNLRAEPSTSGKVILVMPSGSTVKLLSGTAAGWRQVSYQGTTGWAATSYLN